MFHCHVWHRRLSILKFVKASREPWRLRFLVGDLVSAPFVLVTIKAMHKVFTEFGERQDARNSRNHGFTFQILLGSHWIFHWINSAVCNGSTCLKNTPKWREPPHSINIPEGLAPHFPSASNILRTGVERDAKNPQTTRTVEHLEIVGEAKSNSWGDNRLPRAIIPKELHIQALLTTSFNWLREPKYQNLRGHGYNNRVIGLYPQVIRCSKRVYKSPFTKI